MASKADRARARKARTAQAAARAAADRAGGVVPSAKASGAPAPKRPAASAADQTGLEMLRDKGRITLRQFDSGRRYGWLWRNAHTCGGPARVADLSRAGGGGGDGPPIGDEAVIWIASIRQELGELDACLRGDEDDSLLMIVAMICGAGMRPREITSLQRETEQIEAALRVALDLVGRRLRELGARGVTG